jgi:hypothetical protein
MYSNRPRHTTRNTTTDSSHGECTMSTQYNIVSLINILYWKTQLCCGLPVSSEMMWTATTFRGEMCILRKAQLKMWG